VFSSLAVANILAVFELSKRAVARPKGLELERPSGVLFDPFAEVYQKASGLTPNLPTVQTLYRTVQLNANSL